MSLLNTMLGVIALCAALLFGISVALGPVDQQAQAKSAGLTAAAVLASDGMGPDGRVARSAGAAPGSVGIAVGQPAG
jgi:hypothetical protein